MPIRTMRRTTRSISSNVSTADRSSHGSPSAGMQYWQRKLQRSVTEMRTSPIGRPCPSTSGSRGVIGTGLPTRLVEQHDRLDDDALLDALDHVVHGERAHRRRRE